MNNFFLKITLSLELLKNHLEQMDSNDRSFWIQFH